MYYDRFDIVAAHYAFYADWHQGQNSTFYSRLSRIGRYYSPSDSARHLRGEEYENARQIYANLRDLHNC
jgi:hypothetical protein